MVALYVPFYDPWVDGAAGGTPLVAAALQQIEQALKVHSTGFISKTDANAAFEPIGTSGVVKVAEQILSAAAATVTFSSIPGTYRSLRLMVHARGDAAAAAVALLARVNGDSTAVYDLQGYDSNGTALTAGASTGAASWDVGAITAANGPVGGAGILDLHLPDYARTAFWKSGQSVSGEVQSSTSRFLRARHLVWRNTAAVNSLSLLTSSGNFVPGSVFTLYGIR